MGAATTIERLDPLEPYSNQPEWIDTFRSIIEKNLQEPERK